MAENEAPAPLVWIDMEMSGLDPETCAILEVAVLITNGELEEIAEGPDIVVHQPQSVLAAMDEWNTKHHGESGLTARVQASTVSLAEAEEQVLSFVAAHTKAGASPLCGNSVHQDRAFIARYMPRLHAHLHYRNIDVSTLKELVKRWYPSVPVPTKKEAHRALSDIRESLDELRYYRSRVFREEISELRESGNEARS
jgi:oligoribonuclease